MAGRWIDVLASFISLDLVTLGIPLECIGVGSFHGKLWVYILTPLTVIGATILVAAATGLRQRACHPYQLLKTSVLRAAPFCLFVAFLSMPFVTSLAARSFLYECFKGDACYLRADYAVSVGEHVQGSNEMDWDTITPAWQQIRGTAWIGLSLYPLGQEVIFLLLLLRVRRTIKQHRSAELSRALSFLHVDFKPQYKFFELVNMAAKILLVGFATMVEPNGSIIQVTFGLLVALGQLVLLASTQPYRRRMTNATAIGCSLVTVLVFVACLHIKNQVLVSTLPPDATSHLLVQYDIPDGFVVAFLLASTLAAFGIAIVLSVLHLWTAQRLPVARTQGGHAAQPPLLESGVVWHLFLSHSMRAATQTQ